MEINDIALSARTDEIGKLCRTDTVHLCDGSTDEYEPCLRKDGFDDHSRWGIRSINFSSVIGYCRTRTPVAL